MPPNAFRIESEQKRKNRSDVIKSAWRLCFVGWIDGGNSCVHTRTACMDETMTANGVQCVSRYTCYACRQSGRRSWTSSLSLSLSLSLSQVEALQWSSRSRRGCIDIGTCDTINKIIIFIMAYRHRHSIRILNPLVMVLLSCSTLNIPCTLTTHVNRRPNAFTSKWFS